MTPADEATVEAVAKAIAEAEWGAGGWARIGENMRQAHRNTARAAITAYESARGDVKPDRETVIASVHRSASLTRDEEGWIADAVLADWPGRTEREVAEEAWDEAHDNQCETFSDAGFCHHTNPHRAKGADE